MEFNKKTMKPLKDKESKSAIEYIVPEFILEIGHVLYMGSIKYKPNSWQGVPLSDHYASAMRHILQWKKGEKNDKESGRHHLIHAATNLMFIFFNEKTNEDKFDNTNIS